jgi:hypothetical protein
VDPELVERYGPVTAARLETRHRAEVRRAARRRLLWTVPLPVAAVAGLFALNEGIHGGGPLGKGIAFAVKCVAPIAAATAVPLLVTVLEAVTGYRAGELSARWDALAGWQRGVAGTLVAVGALALFGSIALAVAASLGG